MNNFLGKILSGASGGRLQDKATADEEQAAEEEISELAQGEQPLIHRLFGADVSFSSLKSCIIGIFKQSITAISKAPECFKCPPPALILTKYISLVTCVITVVMTLRVPDIYGYGMVISALEYCAEVGIVLVLVYYALRVWSGVNLENLFATVPKKRRSFLNVSDIFSEVRSDFYTLIFLGVAAAILVFHKFRAEYLLAAGFFYSFVYFIIFSF
ncbi:MAG: hypothetical protein AB1546_09940, partial [bacterium]